MTSRSRLTAVLTAGALLAAGCGGDDAPAPATLAPSSASAYAEVQLRPGADVSENLEAAAGKLLGTDDGSAALARLLGPALERGGLSFARDVEPWLGDTAAVAVTGAREGVALVATTDDDGALAAVRRGRRVRETSYRGVDVGVAGRRASAVVDGTLVAGSVRAVRAVIDVAEGAREPLASSPRFTRAREDAGAEGSPGFAYVDVRRALSSAASGAKDVKAGLLLGALSSAGLETLGVAFEGDGDALRVRGALRSAEALPGAGGGAGAAEAVAGAPADALLAVGVGDVGGTVTRTLDGLDGLLGVGAEAVLGQVRAQTGLDVRRDLLAWMGDAALVVRGKSLADATGALVLRSRDAAASARALPRLVAVLRSRGLRLEATTVAGADRAWSLRGAQHPVVLAVGGSRVVLGIGRGAARDALAGGGDTLADGERFRRASGLLADGVRPSLWADPAGLASLLGGAPPEAERTLRAIDAVVAGGRADGVLQRFEAAVALR